MANRVTYFCPIYIKLPVPTADFAPPNRKHGQEKYKHAEKEINRL